MIRIQIILAVLIMSAIAGCSTGLSPVTSGIDAEFSAWNSGIESSRIAWGFWTIRIDPDRESFEIIPHRQAGQHFNVVRLLEVDPCTDCLCTSNLSWLPDNIIQCDFQLTHPFPGLIKLTGFDVRGVLITHGDTLFPAGNRFVSLDGSNPALIDPDGFTDLFNPVEFPPGSAQWPILEYIQGKYSFEDDFTGTLNPFMAFCKEKPRRMFEAGATESVTINLKYPSVPVEFGYVVDASWVKADDIIDPITDFPSDANCIEPYSLDFQMSAVLYDMIGDTADVRVEVFDHQGIDTISTVSIECPSLFDGEVYLDYSSQSGVDSWFYDGVITNQSGADNGQYPLLIKAVSSESDFNLGELAAYQIEEISVLETVVAKGNLIWAKQGGGESYDRGIKITTLSDDSTVLTGYFHKLATFGEGEANETALFSGGQMADILVARYNPDGTLAWAKRAGGNYMDNGMGITALSDDSTVVTGYFSDSATFGKGEANETVLVSYANWDMFVARYNPDGTLEWAKRAGGSSNQTGFAVTVLSDDSTVVTGYFTAATTFGEGEANETTLVSDDSWDIFLARYHPDGHLISVKSAGGPDADVGFGITALSDDSIVVTGIFQASVTFGKDEANETVLDTDGEWEIFVARYNPDGTLAWAICTGAKAEYPSNRSGCGITSLSDDSTVVSGCFADSAIFGEGETNETILVSDDEEDIFVARYNPDSALVWAKRAGGMSWDEPNGITSLSDNSIAVTGYFWESAVFGVGEPNETALDSIGNSDIFIALLNSDGTLAWARSMGGTDSDKGYGITSLSNDSPVMTGSFYNLVVFGEGEANETILESHGQNDLFVARFAP